MTQPLHDRRATARPAHRAGRLLCILVPALILQACASSRGAVRHARLNHGFESKEAVAEAVLRALAAEDLQALKDMALTGNEFERFVWPELPASRRKTNLTVRSIWNSLNFRSTNRLGEIFGRFKGRKLRLVRLIQRGPTSEYASHIAFSDLVVIARDESGKESEYPLFGTLIEMDGVWKVYSFAPYD